MHIKFELENLKQLDLDVDVSVTLKYIFRHLERGSRHWADSG
jgi:hypothetical protein